MEVSERFGGGIGLQIHRCDIKTYIGLFGLYVSLLLPTPCFPVDIWQLNPEILFLPALAGVFSFAQGTISPYTISWPSGVRISCHKY